MDSIPVSSQQPTRPSVSQVFSFSTCSVGPMAWRPENLKAELHTLVPRGLRDGGAVNDVRQRPQDWPAGGRSGERPQVGSLHRKPVTLPECVHFRMPRHFQNERDRLNPPRSTCNKRNGNDLLVKSPRRIRPLECGASKSIRADDSSDAAAAFTREVSMFRFITLVHGCVAYLPFTVTLLYARTATTAGAPQRRTY